MGVIGAKGRDKYPTHIAYFGGRNNQVKARVLTWLYMNRGNHGITAKEIAERTGVNYDYLKSRLGKWWEWGYLARRPSTEGKGRAIYRYGIARRGEHFVENRIPNELRIAIEAELRRAIEAELRIAIEAELTARVLESIREEAH